MGYNTLTDQSLKHGKCNEEEQKGCHWSGKILQGQRKIREFYFESGKIDISKKSQELK